jgi:hypothetical protein
MKRVRWFVLFALVLAALALPATAFAAPHASQCTYPEQNCNVPSTVLGITTTPGGAQPGSSTTQQPAAVAAGQSSLPFTGGDIAGLSAVGVGAILIGFLLARSRRNARSGS